MTDQDLSFLQIRPHELRALSSSWAFVNNAPLDDILSAAAWKQSSTFSTFYLRSFSASQGNPFSLGPLVASQQVVTPKLGHKLLVTKLRRKYVLLFSGRLVDGLPTDATKSASFNIRVGYFATKIKFFQVKLILVRNTYPLLKRVPPPTPLIFSEIHPFLGYGNYELCLWACADVQADYGP